MNTELKTPEYVIQPNVISQAMYSLGPYARKLIAMAMSMVSLDDEEYTVSFKATDFMTALGLDLRKQGSETKRYIKAAIQECLNSHIEINKPNGDWEGYTWFTESKLQNFRFEWDWGWDKISMTFNPKLGETIKQFKKAYAKINLADLGKLQSRYAIRFYELALSYAGFAGRDGNRPGNWYFEKTLEDIRILFQVDNKKYKITKDFRVKVIDNPIEEINAADIGLRIEPDYIRKGRRLMGARFNCKWVKPEEPKQTSPATQEGKEEEALISAFPEKYEKYKAEELAQIEAQPNLTGFMKEMPAVREFQAGGLATARLRKEHPDFFKMKK